MPPNKEYDYDFVIIGSGFGGSVSAHRLAEKGYKVAVIEAGKRYENKDFAKTSWNLKKFLWEPLLGLHGIFRMSIFRHAFILSGVGVGGGSLVYGCTLLVPPEKVWDDPVWKGLNKWHEDMPRHYKTAKKMLGVAPNPHFADADNVLKEIAEDNGYGDTFHSTDVGIFFGEPGKKVPDPYFDGKGPERTACNYCGGCMIGCRFGAKNTLDKNYLYFAEKNGVEIIPETLVTDVLPIDGDDSGAKGYEVLTRSSTSIFGKKKRKLKAKGVIFSAGVIGTMKLLFQNKQKGNLPKISDFLGGQVRTNSESIIGVRFEDENKLNMSKGIAIGSRIHIDDVTHIEAVRYPEKSDAMGTITTLLPHKESNLRFLDWIATLVKNPFRFVKSLIPLSWAKNSVILLVMQTLDNSLKIDYKRSLLWPFSKTLGTKGKKLPTSIPKANRFAEKMAAKHGGYTITSFTEVLLDVPTTAHILGGAVMGKDQSSGVIDHNNKVFNYKNLYVVDGSMIGANLGVNPSLTITALAEHAMEKVPLKSENPDFNN